MTDKLNEEKLLLCFINGWIPDKELTKDGKECKRKIIALIKKPEVTEEWIEEGANYIGDMVGTPWSFTQRRDFIRSLVKKIQGVA